jgi:pimeloyl-ACP methyl ester carboxylesterase
MSFDPNISFDHAQIGSVRLHYARAGDGQKLIVLLHGFPECWYSWRHQLSALSDYYTVVAPDLRGYNQSEKPSGIGNYKIDMLADDILGLIDHLGKGKAAVIGHDWGASIAWSIGFRHPEYLSHLGALQVPPASVWKRNLSAKQLFASWYMFFFQLPWLPEYLLSANNFRMLRNAMRHSTARPGVFTDEDLDVYERGWKEDGALTAMLNYYRANLFDRLRSSSSVSRKISVPSLFIYGQQDTALVPDTVQHIGDVIDAKFDEFFLPTSGHWVQQEEPETVTQIIRDFLTEN